MRTIPRKVIPLLTSVLIVAVYSLTLPVAQAEGMTPHIGVEADDWANYRISRLDWYIHHPVYNGELPPELEIVASMEWFLSEVIEVSENTVTMQWTTYYADTTTTTELVTGDPIDGSGNLADGLAPAGLGPGDQFYIWLEELGYPGPTEVTIDETTARTYAGESREVNRVELELPVILEEIGEIGSTKFEYYFDKETGILCGGTVWYSHEIYFPDFGWSYFDFTFSLAMVETNMWGPGGGIPGYEPQFPASEFISDPEHVTEDDPVIIDAAEMANTTLFIFSISDSTIIKIEPAIEVPPVPSGLQTVGNSILIDTSRMVSTSAILKISYDPDELFDKGIVESSLAIHYWDGSEWVRLESEVNFDERYVLVEIDHFSYWALMGEIADEAIPPDDEPIDNPPIEEGLASISDNLLIVYAWRPATQTWDMYWPQAGIDTIGALEMGKGYWILVDSHCVLEYGTRSYELHAGWNNVGWLPE